MAVSTLKKNSLLKYFEILKDKFFKIIILNSIFFTVLSLLLVAVMGINYLVTKIFGPIPDIFMILTFLPLVLLAPVVAAIMKIMRDFVREEPGFFWQDFKKAFKDNFKQSILVGIFQYVIIWAIIIAVMFYYPLSKDSTLYTIGLGVTFFVAIAMLAASYYLYMMTVTLDLKTVEIIKNSFIFTMLCFGKNILLTLILAVWIIFVGIFVFAAVASQMALLYGLVICLFMTLAFGIVFYTVAFFTFPSVKKYILDPYYEEHPLESSESVLDGDGNFKSDNANIDELPEFVYHNGKMVHRDALKKESVFSDEAMLTENKEDE